MTASQRLGSSIAAQRHTSAWRARHGHGFNPDDMIGLELDDVLEGPDVLPVPIVADREAQVIRMPPLSDEERAAQAAAAEAERTERRRRGAELFRQYAVLRERALGLRVALPPGMPRPDASLTSAEVEALVGGGWPADPRWRGRHLTRRQAAALEVLRQRKRAAVREVIERHLATRGVR